MLVAIEAKRSQYSLEVGLPQLLFYMLNNQTPEVPTFGLLTNGSNFRFVKLMKGDNLQYSVSRIFDILNVSISCGMLRKQLLADC
ncbi:hypothetical protein [Okeania sp. KiyG1]|uniref:hypothetical protein n=1 Tax=Okeania sp. KiyG1 TaxID=2720165 RepID=UPI001924EB35|nr:hypothetical protein [Okeania sp. KiyG1]GGA04369.1 hypothetical protein CYANOKiyG1_16720 [Okeania sp. KiyG1]